MLHVRPRVPLRPLSLTPRCLLSTLSAHSTQWHPLPSLPDSSLSTLRTHALAPLQPHLLPKGSFSALPAITKWFTTTDHHHPSINSGYLSPHADTLVPLEYTNPSTGTFSRTNAPLSLLLSYLEYANAAPTGSQGQQDQLHARPSFYLAQCPLSSLPRALQSDLPTPEMVLHAGKGDIYNSSLWLGLAPTSTPLHRDPNPNLFVQLAGTKVVRLLRPEVGDEVLAMVEAAVGRAGGSRVRGEEMMVGEERAILERVVWGGVGGGGEGGDGGDGERLGVQALEGLEAVVEKGDAVFIPNGWWHAIRGVGDGVTGSVNWWFR